MRTIILMLLAILINTAIANDAISIKDAINQKLIAATFMGSDESTHYIKPIEVQIKNLTPRPLNIKIDQGYTLHSIDPDYQDFIILHEELMALAPNQLEELPLYAMCIQKSNAAPGQTTKYELGETANENLIKVARVIDENKYFNTVGQYAIWSISDDAPVQYIAGFDTTASRILQELVCEITNQPIPEFIPGDYTSDYYDPVITMKIYGSFGFTSSEIVDVTVAMFDTTGIVVRELFNKKDIAPGDYEYEYAFDGTVYTDELYYLKMIMNNEVVSNMEMRMYDE